MKFFMALALIALSLSQEVKAQIVTEDITCKLMTMEHEDKMHLALIKYTVKTTIGSSYRKETSRAGAILNHWPQSHDYGITSLKKEMKHLKCEPIAEKYSCDIYSKDGVNLVQIKNIDSDEVIYEIPEVSPNISAEQIAEDFRQAKACI